MTEPRTEAGRALVRDRALPWRPGQPGYDAMVEGFIPTVLAIEAEAVAAERARIAAAVRALPAWDKRSVPGGFHVKRAAVLAIIEAES